MHSSPTALLGNICYTIAAIVSVVLGIKAMPAIASILAGAAIFTVGYVFVRLPQVLGIFQRDGAKAFLMIFYVLVINSVVSGAFYGVGRLFS